MSAQWPGRQAKSELTNQWCAPLTNGFDMTWVMAALAKSALSIEPPNSWRPFLGSFRRQPALTSKPIQPKGTSSHPSKKPCFPSSPEVKGKQHAHCSCLNNCQVYSSNNCQVYGSNNCQVYGSNNCQVYSSIFPRLASLEHKTWLESDSVIFTYIGSQSRHYLHTRSPRVLSFPATRWV